MRWALGYAMRPSSVVVPICRDSEQFLEEKKSKHSFGDYLVYNEDFFSHVIPESAY